MPLLQSSASDWRKISSLKKILRITMWRKRWIHSSKDFSQSSPCKLPSFSMERISSSVGISWSQLPVFLASRMQLSPMDIGSVWIINMITKPLHSVNRILSENQADIIKKLIKRICLPETISLIISKGRKFIILLLCQNSLNYSRQRKISSNKFMLNQSVLESSLNYIFMFP